MSLIKHSILGAAIALASANASALVVTPIDSGSTLVNTILGSGVTVNPASINYVGGTGQAGTFTGGLAAGIGIDQGIILTSGKASLAQGPNSSSGEGHSWGSAGDSDLNALVGGSTFDANVLEFQFTSTGGDLFFNYVFASEEYNEYINSAYNDVFAFLVDGVNIAKIGADPVSIDTVNCGNPYGSGGVNCDQFVNNETGTYDLQYDGFTKVLTASIFGLSAGTHTMKLAIADRGDTVLDSTVFVEANSFSDKPTTPNSVPEPATLSLVGLGLVGVVLGRRRKSA